MRRNAGHEGDLLNEDSFLSRDMKKTVLKIRILGRISAGKVNSYALLKEFSAKGDLARFFSKDGGIKNEIYNTINSLQRSGYIKLSEKLENGRMKHYYTVTRKGRGVLRSAKAVLRSHLEELEDILGG